MNQAAFQRCIHPDCLATYDVGETIVACRRGGGLLDIEYDWDKLQMPRSLSFFESRWSTKGTQTQGRVDFSGVWRFRELLPFFRSEMDIVTIGEGRTVLQNAELL